MDEIETNEVVVSTPATETVVEGGEAQGAAEAVESQESTKDAGTPSSESVDSEQKKADEAAVAAFKARDKYKIRSYGSDKQEEREVPPWLKGLMKDEASEKQVIDLLERADGLEPVKAHREEIRKERDTYKQSLGEFQRQISDVRDTFRRGDIDGFFEKLDIPRERILQWAVDQVHYSQLPPEQQKILDERKEAQRQAHEASQQVQTYESQLQEQSRTAKQAMLELGLRQPDVKSFADAYEERTGRPGSFQEEVIATGYQAYVQSEGKVDLTPAQAIELTLKKWKAFITPGTPQAAQPPVQMTQNQQHSAPPVIPNVQGGSKSPLKSKVRSLDDLKKLGAAANG